MNHEITATIFPFKLGNMDKRSEILYRIIDDYKSKNNMLLSKIVSILCYIDENEVVFQGVNKMRVFELFSSLMNIHLFQVNVIFSFLFDEELISVCDGKLRLSNYGRLFLISDKASAILDILNYFWDKSDWTALFSIQESNRFLDHEARKYLACILYQMSDEIIDFKHIRLKHDEIDKNYFNYFNAVNELADSKVMRLLIDYVFEPMGLIKNLQYNSNFGIRLTELGKKVFEMYSREMMQEYRELLEECWECYDRGNFEQAHDIAKNIMAVIPSLPETYNIVGCVHIKLKEFKKAKSIFEYAIDICDNGRNEMTSNKKLSMDNYISLYYNLGLCYFYNGEFFNAMRVFKDIKKTVPYTLENVENVIRNIKRIIVLN